MYIIGFSALWNQRQNLPAMAYMSGLNKKWYDLVQNVQNHTTKIVF